MFFLTISLSYGQQPLPPAKIPLHIDSDSASYQGHFSFFSGHVHLYRQTDQLWCDKLVLKLDKNNQVQLATATGKPARFQIQNKDNLIRGQALTILFWPQQKKWRLNEKAIMQQKQNKISAARIDYDQKRDLFSAEVQGKQKPHITFYPTKSTL